MVAPVILIEASPRRAVDGVAEQVRLAGGGGAKPYRYPDAAGGADQDWRAGVLALPTIVCALAFDGTDLGTGAVPQAAEIVWAPARSADLDAIAGYFWFDAAIKVRIGPEGASPPIVISGKVLNASVGDGQLKISLADPAAGLKKPVPLARYAGTGDLEGPVEWAGKLKDRIWGRVWNKPGEPIDKANNIYAFADPTRPLQAIDAVRDKGAAAASLTTVAWQGSVAATLAALRAAVAPQGGGVRCPSLACVKWWTQPAGDLCADLKGEIGAAYVETTAGIASALVSALGGPVFAAGTVAAAAAARPAPIGWVVNDDSTTVAAMLDELLGNSSLLWLLSLAGEIVIRQWAWGASAAAAKSHQVTRTEQLRPVHTRKIGYQRNELPMARGDLAAIVLATDATYLDGTPIENLKPAEAAANKTETRIAAAIAGQGAFATLSTVGADDTARVTLPARLAPSAIHGPGYLDAAEIAWTDGGTVEQFKPAEAAANKTETRIAAAIAGQGAYATVSSVSYGSSFLTGFGPLAARAKVSLGDGFVFRADGATALTDALAVTSLGIAAAIAGQGGLATKSVADWSLDVTGAGKPESYATAADAFNADAAFAKTSLPDWSLNGFATPGNMRVQLPDDSPARYGVKLTPADLIAVGVGIFTALPVWPSVNVSPGQIYPQAVVAGTTLYLSVNLRFIRSVAGTKAVSFSFQGDFADAGAYIASVATPVQTYSGADSEWLFLEGAIAVPAGARSGNIFLQIVAEGNNPANFQHDIYFTNFRYGRAATGATVGARVGTNVYRPGNTIYTQAELETALGTAAAIAGQTAWATYGGSTGRVANLNDVGRAAAGFASSGDARPFAKLVSSGASINGEAVSFGTSYGQVPKIAFGMGGKAPSAGTEVQVRADGLTVSGFTMKAVEVALTPGTTYTDSVEAVGGVGQPQRVMHKSQNIEPWDGKYTFRLAVTVPQLQQGEPGFIDVAIFARQGGVWTQVGYRGFTADGAYDVVLTPGAIPQTADYEFGVSVGDATNGATLDALVSVKYTSGTITETALTANTTIPWIAHLEQ